MPYGNIKITRRRQARAKGRTHQGSDRPLVSVLDMNPATTFVVIDEVEMEDWGIWGLPVEEYRRKLSGRR
jgi:4-oxalocrotonate tautomerase